MGLAQKLRSDILYSYFVLRLSSADLHVFSEVGAPEGGMALRLLASNDPQPTRFDLHIRSDTNGAASSESGPLPLWTGSGTPQA